MGPNRIGLYLNRSIVSDPLGRLYPLPLMFVIKERQYSVNGHSVDREFRFAGAKGNWSIEFGLFAERPQPRVTFVRFGNSRIDTFATFVFETLFDSNESKVVLREFL